MTFDTRTDGFPTFSRDGTRIAFKRLPVPNSKPNWQDWGDIVVADVDGGHPIVLDRNVHSPSPMSWSADGRFLIYSKTVDGVDQVFVAATDGTSTRQITSGREANWGPTPVSRRPNRGVREGLPDRNRDLRRSRSTAHASADSRDFRSRGSTSPSGRWMDPP